MKTKLNATRLECRVTPTVFIVNSALDTVAVDGVVTLREAILAANTNTAVGDAPAGTNMMNDEIRFNLPAGSGPIIVTGTELPAITEGISILGDSQPGYAGSPLVSLASQGTYDTNPVRLRVGLRLEGHTGSTIKGLYIVGFDQYQISIDRAPNSSAVSGQHFITSNWIAGDIARSPAITKSNGINIRGDGLNFFQENRFDLCGEHFVLVESDGNTFHRNQFGWYDTTVLKVQDAVVLGQNSLDTTRLASSNTFGGVDNSGGNSLGNSFARYEYSGIRAVLSEYTNAFLGNVFRGGSSAISIGRKETGSNATPPDVGHYPVLTSATSDGNNTIVTGTLQGRPNLRYRLEFFAGAPGTTSVREGRAFLGYFDVITDAQGISQFTTNQLLLPVRGNITATATERLVAYKITSATSEFSESVVVHPKRLLAVGTDAGTPSQAKLFNPDGTVKLSLQPYGGFTGGVRVASGDVNGDNVDDLMTAAGPGGGPHVKVFSGADGSLLASFFAYTPGFNKGVFVATGDLNGDGVVEIITGADAGGGPHVQTFYGLNGTPSHNFFAYAQEFSGGIRVAAGDVDGDGIDEIITGAGVGGGPHVKVFDLFGYERRSFFAYDPNFSNGIYVTAGDFDGDGKAEIITGAGAGGGPHVKVFDGITGSGTQGFFAYAPSFSGGVRVAMADLNQDGTDELIVGAGPGGGPHVQRFKFDRTDLGSFFAFDERLTSGIFVGA